MFHPYYKLDGNLNDSVSYSLYKSYRMILSLMHLCHKQILETFCQLQLVSKNYFELHEESNYTYI